MTNTIGLVGCGAWGRHILRDLKSLGCTIHVVARSESSVARAHGGGADTVVSRVDALPEVAGIVVAVPTDRHAAVVDEVLTLRVPVFVEKPLTNDVAAARRLGDAPDVFVMDKWRYHPGVEALRDLLRSGEQGPATMLATLRHSRSNPHRDVDAVWILAPHDLSIVLEVLGTVPPALAAVGEVADKEGSLVGLLGGDTPCVIDVSSRREDHVRRVRLHFNEAVATLGGGYEDAVEIHHTVPGGEPRTERLAVSTEMPLLRELRAFVEHLDGGPPPRSSAAEGATIVERIAELRSLAGI